MVKTPLVSLDIDDCKAVLTALDQAKLGICVAVWAYLDYYEDWRFVLAGKHLDAVHILNGYGTINDAIRAAGITEAHKPPLLLLPLTDPLIKALRRSNGKSKQFEPRRIGGHMIGNRFVDDGYAFRIS